MPPGSSVIQDVILEKIHNMGLQQPPAKSIESSRTEVHKTNLM